MSADTENVDSEPSVAGGVARALALGVGLSNAPRISEKAWGLRAIDCTDDPRGAMVPTLKTGRPCAAASPVVVQLISTPFSKKWPKSTPPYRLGKCPFRQLRELT